MDNQHKLIKGYRDLNEAEIGLMNEIKAQEATVDALMAKLAGTPTYPTPPAVSADLPSHDPHLIKIARDHLMIGFMLAVRAIAKPGTPERAKPPATLDASLPSHHNANIAG